MGRDQIVSNTEAKQRKDIVMSGITGKVAAYMIKKKTERITRKLQNPMSFPIRSNVIQRVLVILPRNLSLLDLANRFIHALREAYPTWRVELFDVDKLGSDDLNRMKLPKQEIIDRLRKADYHFVLDLNDKLDELSAYITLMTEAPYRLRLQSEGSLNCYNIVYHPEKNGEEKAPYESLLSYLNLLFVLN